MRSDTIDSVGVGFRPDTSEPGRSQIIKFIFQGLVGLGGVGLTNQVPELVGVEAGGGYSDRAGPIVVVVALVVGELPEHVLGEAGLVIADDEELGAGDRTA